MTRYDISWEAYGIFEIRADTEEQALDLAAERLKEQQGHLGMDGFTIEAEEAL